MGFQIWQALRLQLVNLANIISIPFLHLLLKLERTVESFENWKPEKINALFLAKQKRFHFFFCYTDNSEPQLCTVHGREICLLVYVCRQDEMLIIFLY